MGKFRVKKSYFREIRRREGSVMLRQIKKIALLLTVSLIFSISYVPGSAATVTITDYIDQKYTDFTTDNPVIRFSSVETNTSNIYESNDKTKHITVKFDVQNIFNWDADFNVKYILLKSENDGVKLSL